MAVKGKGAAKKFHHRRPKQLDRDLEEIAFLEATIKAGAPPSGSNPLASNPLKDGQKASQASEGASELQPYAGVRAFDELPISERTKKGLKEAKYVSMTAIQRAAIPHALAGRDVLGAAKTGSGKTLAFLVPTLEKLYRLRWGPMDGVGALVISPTRELALQIFSTLKTAGKHHNLSAGLLIGGHSVEQEKERINSLNILVCTPGRLLQHMDETPNFDCSQLQVLVLDEADRILDMGFSACVNAILRFLPKTGRQTFLYSATQTKSVRDLARLSLKHPEYLSVHAEASAATPLKLHQTAIMCPLEEKLDMLWSFIKTHLNTKTIVFLSTCKQVKFVYEAFKHLRPGVPLKALHGKMKQAKRMLVFQEFCDSKAAVLFATDIAARGLDFPSVDWVVQVDCPPDAAEYIHRVGRTARYTSAGRSLLFLLPSEQAMVQQLRDAKVPVKVIKANPTKIQSTSSNLAGVLSQDPELKYTAQRAFVSYLRSVNLQPNKEVFDVTRLPITEFAASLGLPNAPRIRFRKKGAAKEEGLGLSPKVNPEENGGGEENGSEENEDDGKAGGVNKPGMSGRRIAENGRGDVDDDVTKLRTNEKGGKETASEGATESGGLVGEANGDTAKEAKKRSKMERLFGRKNADVLSDAYQKLRASDDDEAADISGDEAGDLLRVKRKNHGLDGEDGESSKGALVKTASKKKRMKIDPGAAGNNRLLYDEEGNTLDPLAALSRDRDESGVDNRQRTMNLTAAERFKKLREEMKVKDAEDKRLEKERLRALRLQKKRKEKVRSGDAEREENAAGAQLGGAENGGEEGGYGSESDGAAGSESDGDQRSDGSEGGVAGIGEGEVGLSESDGEGDYGDEEAGGTSDADEDVKEDCGTGKGKRKLGLHMNPAGTPSKKVRRREAEDLSLADQEALALKLLSSRR